MTTPEQRSGPLPKEEAAQTLQLASNNADPIVPRTTSTVDDIAVDNWWHDGALRALTDLATTGRPFSADNLREPPYALPSPSHPAQWGGLFQTAVKAGLIVPCGFAQSRTSSRHGAITRLWQGTQNTQAAA